MTSRERVKRAVEFREPDRVPVEHYVFPGTFLRYGEKLEKLFKKYPDDFGNIHVEENARIAKQEAFLEGGYVEYRDIWGTLWKRLRNYTIGEVIEPALAGWDRWGGYRFPSPFPPQHYAEFAENVIGSKHPEFYVLAYGGSLFQQVQDMRGTENALVDLAEGKKEMFELLDRLVDFHVSNMKGYIDAGTDGIIFGDDWGTQTALFISPAMWRRIFKPRYKKLFDAVKNGGKHVFFHTDGWILDILEDFVEIGVDVINPQHNIMDNGRVADKIAGRICLLSDLDRQHVIPRGTEAEIREHTAEIIRLFGRRGGGLILHGEAGPEVPFENIEAMCRCFIELGEYPVSKGVSRK